MLQTDKSELQLFDLKSDHYYGKNIAEGNADIVARIQDFIRQYAVREVPVLDIPFPFRVKIKKFWL